MSPQERAHAETPFRFSQCKYLAQDLVTTKTSSLRKGDIMTQFLNKETMFTKKPGTCGTFVQKGRIGN